MEYLKLFQAICSEIDVIGKIVASIVDLSFKPTKETGINEWWYYLYSNDYSIESQKCCLLGKQILQPWKNYRVKKNTNPDAKRFILDETTIPKAKTPSWWKDYNSVKHNRTGHYQKNASNYAKANLRNLFLSFAALYLLEVKLIRITCTDNEKLPLGLESKLFTDSLPCYTEVLSIF